MATALANRLRRLEAIREASNRLMNAPATCSATCFPRGNPERIAEIRHPKFTATLFDLLTAYAAQRQQRVLATVHLAKRDGVVAGRGARVAGAAGRDGRGLELRSTNILLDLRRRSLARATVFASSFAAALELVREGACELHQKRRSRRCIFESVRRKQSDAMTAPDLPAE